MTGSKKKDGDSEEDSGFITPDSTTKDKGGRFCEGEDVLSHGKDGLYYLGTIVMVDHNKERCLIQFEDSTAHWSLFKDITKLRIPESDELCVICKSSRGFEGNEIIICSYCEQGYHQNCLEPKVSDEFCDSEHEWVCPKCTEHSTPQKGDRRSSLKTTGGSSPRKTRQSKQHEELNIQNSLPYELDKLTWDSAHKTNKEHTYCYCGGPGEWYNRMLKCHRCSQWFHEACIENLHFPLMFGDRFYVFICSICNRGSEFVHRLMLKWVDIAHLALFNLTLLDTRMFFDFDKAILPWISDHWDDLQCSNELQRVKISERKQEIVRVLRLNRNRFRCGKEKKKKSTDWGLRAKAAPPVPEVTLPTDSVITERSVKQFVITRKKNLALSPPLRKMVRLQDEIEDSPRSNRVKKSLGRDLPLDGDEECVPETGGVELRKRRKTELDVLIEDKKTNKTLNSLVSQNHPNDKDDSQREEKKKRGRPVCKKLELAPKKTRLREKEGEKREVKEDNGRDTNGQSDSQSLKGQPVIRGESSGDDSSSHGTLDSFIPPPSNFEGQNHPFFSLDILGNGNVLPGRPINRKLNESDIIIGKNGEIKRKKLRKKNDKAHIMYLNQQITALNRFSGLNRFTNPLGLASNLRKVPHRFSENVSLSDLKSNMTSYFGASNRIASGHKFTILAKRTNSDCKVQYLIEWDNGHGSST